eukprot:3941121-Rhodomonas_salina.4
MGIAYAARLSGTDLGVWGYRWPCLLDPQSDVEQYFQRYNRVRVIDGGGAGGDDWAVFNFGPANGGGDFDASANENAYFGGGSEFGGGSAGTVHYLPTHVVRDARYRRMAVVLRNPVQAKCICTKSASRLYCEVGWKQKALVLRLCVLVGGPGFENVYGAVWGEDLEGVWRLLYALPLGPDAAGALCYAMSGTEIAYGAQQCAVLSWRMQA